MHKKQNNNVSPNKRIQSVYTIPDDYDKTPALLLSLDHYLLNKDVYCLVKTLFESENEWDNWAINNPFDALSYFSPPYCSEAHLLGYKCNTFKPTFKA